ncbi:beta strand repeat-containing protein [Candidatus Margulisiibacteriota bacterium]
MKKLLIGLLIIGMVVITAFGVPNSIQYKGRLMESGVLVNGTKTFSFIIYDSLINGSALWSTGNMGINVDQGVYSVKLGDAGNPITPNALAGGSAYLEITVAGEILLPRMRIDSVAYALQAGAVTGEENVFPSDGSVGIGTTDPSYNLHVFDGTTSTRLLIGDDIASTETDLRGFRIDANTNDEIYLDAKVKTAGKLHFRIGGGTQTGAQTEWMTVDPSAGNVGIGDVDPATKLEVAGTVSANAFVGDGSALTGVSSTDTGWDHTATENIILGSNYLSGDGGDEGVFVSSNGNVGIGTTDPTALLHVDGDVAANYAGTFMNSNADGYGVYIKANNVLTNRYGLYVTNSAGNPSLVVRNDGNVGIGTAAPSYTLDVSSAGDAYGTVARFNRSGDSNYGLYFRQNAAGADAYQSIESKNILSFQVGATDTSQGTQGMRIQADGDIQIMNGSVGIGTTAPGAKMEITADGNNLWLTRDTIGTFQFGIASDGAGHPELRIKDVTDDTVRMAIDTDGNVGIGTTDPGTSLDVYRDNASGSAISSALLLQRTTSATPAAGLGGAISYTVENSNNEQYIAGRIATVLTNVTDGSEAANMEFYVGDGATHAGNGAARRMTITNTGSVGIGTTAPTYTLEVSGSIKARGYQAKNESSDTAIALYSYSDNSSDNPYINLLHYRGSIETPTVTQVDDVLGEVRFSGYDTGGSIGAKVIAYADAEWGTSGDASDAPSRLEFQTAADGSGTYLPRMTIKNDGDVGIGTTAPGAKLHVASDAYLLLEYQADQNNDGSNDDILLNFTTGTGTLKTEIRYDETQDTFEISRSDNADHFVIDSDGNVGIGTANPTVKLDVAGNIRAGNVDDARIFSYSAENSSGMAGFTGQSIGGSGGFHLISPVTGATSHVNTAGNYDTYLSTRYAGNNLLFAVGNAEKMRVDGTNGSVGIGTTNPTDAKLVVSDSAAGDKNLAWFESTWSGVVSTNTFSIPILAYRNGNDQRGAKIVVRNTNWPAEQSSIAFETNTDDSGTFAERLRINPNGYVGIGTSNPLAKLAVSNSNEGFEVSPESNLVKIYAYDRTNANYEPLQYKAISHEFKYGASQTTGMAITSGGKVGIGTTDPSAYLEISGPSGASSDLMLEFQKAGGFGQTGFYQYYVSSADWGWEAKNANGESMLRVNNDQVYCNTTFPTGNVGIGTTTPSYPLHILQTTNPATVITPTIALDVNATNGSSILRLDRPSNYRIAGIEHATNGSEDWWSGVLYDASGNSAYSVNTTYTLAGSKFVIDTNGNVGIGTTNPIDDLTIDGGVSGSSASILLSEVDNIGFKMEYDGITNVLSFRGYESGNKPLGIAIARDSGNVGIGTTDPSQKLSVGLENDNGMNIRLGGWASLGNSYSAGATILGNNAIANTVTADGMTFMTTNGSFGARAIRMDNSRGIAFHTLSGSVTAGEAFTSERMRINNEGCVGIGTTNPAGYALRASGNVMVGDLSINNGIPYRGGISWGMYGYQNWYITGNASDSSVRFKTYTDGSYSDKVTFQNNGNVGIGTTNPSQLLSVDSKSVVNGIHTMAQIGNIGVGGGADTSVYLGYYADGDTATNAFIYSGAKDLAFESYSGGRRENMRILENGYVGIGTTNPLATLSIYHDSSAYSATAYNPNSLKLRGSDTNSDYTGIGFSNAGGTREAFLGVVQTGSASGDLVYQTASGTYGERFRITNAGNVGIGTPDPLSKLSVLTNSADVFPLSIHGDVDASGQWTGIRFGYNNPGNGYQKGGIIYEGVDIYARGKLHFALEGSASVDNVDKSDTKMTIQYDGNVGIGTTDPGETLEVSGNMRISPRGYMESFQLTATSGTTDTFTVPPHFVGQIYIQGQGGNEGKILAAMGDGTGAICGTVTTVFSNGMPSTTVVQDSGLNWKLTNVPTDGSSIGVTIMGSGN